MSSYGVDVLLCVAPSVSIIITFGASGLSPFSAVKTISLTASRALSVRVGELSSFDMFTINFFDESLLWYLLSASVLWIVGSPAYVMIDMCVWSSLTSYLSTKLSTKAFILRKLALPILFVWSITIDMSRGAFSVHWSPDMKERRENKLHVTPMEEV